MMTKKTYNTRTFTECFRMETPIVATNTGGIFKVQANSLPEWSSYSALYNQYAIKKLQFILMPCYNSDDIVAATTPAPYYVPRLAYSVQESPYVQAPVSEQQVLEDNGCKFFTLDRKRVITVRRPTPDVNVETSGTTNVAERTTKLKWFNTDNPEVQLSGGGIPHGTVQWYCANNTALASTKVADVYVRMTIAFRDPA